MASADGPASIRSSLCSRKDIPCPDSARLHCCRSPVLAIGATFLAPSARAATSGAKFKSATATILDSGALRVAFDESGLGNGNITYRLTADATATYACVNGGGKNPSAANKRTVAGQVTAGGTFQSKNGRVVASLVTGPLSPGTFTCPRVSVAC